MTAGSGRRASTYGTASTVTFNGSVNDVFLTYGEKCVVQALIIKALMAYSILTDTRKYRCDFYTTEHATNFCKSHRLDPSEAVY